MSIVPPTLSLRSMGALPVEVVHKQVERRPVTAGHYMHDASMRRRGVVRVR